MKWNSQRETVDSLVKKSEIKKSVPHWLATAGISVLLSHDNGKVGFRVWFENQMSVAVRARSPRGWTRVSLRFVVVSRHVQRQESSPAEVPSGLQFLGNSMRWYVNALCNRQGKKQYGAAMQAFSACLHARVAPMLQSLFLVKPIFDRLGIKKIGHLGGCAHYNS